MNLPLPGSLWTAAGMLVPGSWASLCNGFASLFGLTCSRLFGLTCSQMLLFIQFTALASDVCCPHKQWPDHGDSTICHQEWRGEGNSCTASSPIYVMNPDTGQRYGNWRKEKNGHGILPVFALSQYSWAGRLHVLWKWFSLHFTKMKLYRHYINPLNYNHAGIWPRQCAKHLCSF